MYFGKISKSQRIGGTSCHKGKPALLWSNCYRRFFKLSSIYGVLISSKFLKIRDKLSLRVWAIGLSSILLAVNLIYSLVAQHRADNRLYNVSGSVGGVLPASARTIIAAYGISSGSNNFFDAAQVTIDASTTSVQTAENRANESSRTAVDVSSSSKSNGLHITKVSLTRGSTLYSALLRSNIGRREAYFVANAVNRVYRLQNLKPGQSITIFRAADGQHANLALSIDGGTMVWVHAQKGGSYLAKLATTTPAASTSTREIAMQLKLKQPKLEKKLSDKAQSGGVLSNSPTTYSQTDKKNHVEGRSRGKAVAPSQTLVKYQITMARIEQNADVRSVLQKLGVSSAVLSESVTAVKTVMNEKGLKGAIRLKLINTSKGLPVYFSLAGSSGASVSVYRFGAAGSERYLYQDGSSVNSSSFRAPVDRVNISSRFGLRRDPFRGRARMHYGVDYSASYGSRVIAAAAGTVKTVATHRQYGRYVIVEHDGHYSTLYAHLSKFNPIIKPGTKVAGGELLGYVGASGRATGAHLHLEVRKNGVKVNPESVIGLGGRQRLSSKLMVAFQSFKHVIDLAAAKQVADNSAVYYYDAESGNG